MTASMANGVLVTPSDTWAAWTVAPSVVVPLGVGATAYLQGYRLMRVRSARARPRALAFAGGFLALAIALLSPVDAMSAALFSAHMAQHVLIVMVAAPLLVLSRPILTILAGLPPGLRRVLARTGTWLGRTGAARALHRPTVAWVAFTIALWAWHAPGLYQAAVRNQAVHGLEHSCFLLTAMLVWAVAIEEVPREGLGRFGRPLFLLATGLQGGLLGAVLLFASTPLYPVHGLGPALWGLTPLEDQQLAGALMWIPPMALYLPVSAAQLFRSFRSMEARTPGRGSQKVVA